MSLNLKSLQDEVDSFLENQTKQSLNRLFKVNDTMKDTIIINGIEYVPKVIEPKPVKVGRWKPVEGESFWYLTGRGGVLRDIWQGYSVDLMRYALGNVYQTEGLATQARDKQILLVELQDFADKVNAEYPREYPTIGYEIGYNKDKFITTISSATCFMTIKFNTPQSARSAIEYFGDRLNLLR